MAVYTEVPDEALVRFIDQLLRFGIVHTGQTDTQLHLNAKPIGNLANANHAFNGRIFRHLQLVTACNKLHRANEAGRVTCGKQLLRIRALAAGTTHFFRGCQLNVENAV